MSDLVVYYSMAGNTEYVADKICAETGADRLRLVPKKAYPDKGFAKFMWGGACAVMAEKPLLEEYSVDLSKYDRIIIGYPIWASNYAPPIRTFVLDNKEALKGKRFAAYACQSGKGGEKTFAKLAGLIGISGFEKSAVFVDPKDAPSAEKDAKIEEFVKGL